MVGQKSTNYYFGGKLRRDVKRDWVQTQPSLFFQLNHCFFLTQPSLYFELNHHLFFFTYRFFFLNMQNFDLKQ